MKVSKKELARLRELVGRSQDLPEVVTTNWGCEGGCFGSCQGVCRSGCEGTCWNGCQNSCRYACQGTGAQRGGW